MMPIAAATRSYFKIFQLSALLSLLLLHNQSVESLAGFHPVDPEVLVHLEQLFQGIKDSGRLPVDGELNLLPNNSQGFANMIRCFSENLDDLDASSTTTENTRKLQFNLEGLKTTDKLVAVYLVLKQSPEIPHYQTVLHEIIGEHTTESMKLLDSGEYQGEWMNLKVQEVVDSIDDKTGKRNYKLVLEVKQDGNDIPLKSIIRAIKPMLLVYTYDDKVMEHLSNNADVAVVKTINKRQTESSSSRVREDKEDRAEVQTLEDFREMPCQKQSRYMSFEQMGWPTLDLAVVEPLSTNFSFCIGHCQRPTTLKEDAKFTNHAKLVASLLPELEEAGYGPCCVPTQTTMVPLIFISSSNITTLISYSEVTTCGCF